MDLFILKESNLFIYWYKRIKMLKKIYLRILFLTKRVCLPQVIGSSSKSTRLFRMRELKANQNTVIKEIIKEAVSSVV